MKPTKLSVIANNKWLLGICFIGGLFLAYAGLALASAPPGSAANPLVTQAWVEQYVDEAFAPLEQQLAAIEQTLGGGSIDITLTINSRQALVNDAIETVPVAPQIMGSGYTMVPARFIGEALGLTVTWDEVAREATFADQNQTMVLKIDDRNALINGNTYLMEYPAVIVDGSTLVHVRYVSEAFNCTVEWDDVLRQVIITR